MKSINRTRMIVAAKVADELERTGETGATVRVDGKVYSPKELEKARQIAAKDDEEAKKRPGARAERLLKRKSASETSTEKSVAETIDHANDRFQRTLGKVPGALPALHAVQRDVASVTHEAHVEVTLRNGESREFVVAATDHRASRVLRAGLIAADGVALSPLPPGLTIASLGSAGLAAGAASLLLRLVDRPRSDALRGVAVKLLGLGVAGELIGVNVPIVTASLVGDLKSGRGVKVVEMSGLRSWLQEQGSAAPA